MVKSQVLYVGFCSQSRTSEITTSILTQVPQSFHTLQFTRAVIHKLMAKFISAQLKTLHFYSFQNSAMQFAFKPSQVWSFLFYRRLIK